MSTTTEIALRRFVRACGREARFAAYLGEKKYAAALRSSISNVLAETRAATPTTAAPVVPMSPWLARRKEIARAYAAAQLATLGATPRSR